MWALSLSGTPQWTQITVRARHRLRGGAPSLHMTLLPIGSSSPPVRSDTGYSVSNDVWALSLSGTPTWTQLHPGGPTPPARMLAGAVCNGFGEFLLYGDIQVRAGKGHWGCLGAEPARSGDVDRVVTCGDRAAAEMVIRCRLPIRWWPDGYLWWLWGRVGQRHMDARFRVRPSAYGARIQSNRRADWRPVVILGTWLTGASDVQFNGTHAPILAASFDSISTRVPAGATTGPITVTTPTVPAGTQGNFFVGEKPGDRQLQSERWEGWNDRYNQGETLHRSDRRSLRIGCIWVRLDGLRR